MLVFKANIKVEANFPDDEFMKEQFMKNCEKIVQEGLFKMTVPDWKVEILDIQEE